MPFNDEDAPLIAGRYRLGRLLATGGMGKIYHAEQVPLGRTVAFKVLCNAAMQHDDEFRKRFELEAATCAQLTHPNVVTVFDYGAFDDGGRETCFMVMELVEGVTLSRVLKEQGKLPADRALRIARQIGRALRAAHGIDIVHRDLKPSNVMLIQTDEGESVKVLDFGLAKVVRDDAPDLTHSGKFLGSPRYMSPEQIRGTAVDGRADLYSLGIILYQMLTGRTPFGGEKVVHTLMAHLHEEVPPFRSEDGVSPELQALVMRCLAKQPEDRWRDIKELMSALRTLQATEEQFVSHETPVEYSLDRAWLSTPRAANAGQGASKAAAASAPPETAAVRAAPTRGWGAERGGRPFKRTISVALLGALAGIAVGVATWRGPVTSATSETAPAQKSPPKVAAAPPAPEPVAPADVPQRPAEAAPPNAEPSEATVSSEAPPAGEEGAAVASLQSAPAPVAQPAAVPPVPKRIAPVRRAFPARRPVRRPRARAKPRRSAPAPAPHAAAAPEVKSEKAPVEAKSEPPSSGDAVADVVEPKPAPAPEYSLFAPPPNRARPAKKAATPKKAAAVEKAPPKPAPQPRVERHASISNLSVDGALATSVVRRAVQRLKKRFDACYANSANTSATTPPTAVRVDVTLDPSGRVSASSAAGGAWDSLDTCVASAARRLLPRRRPDVGRVRAQWQVVYDR